MENVITTLRQSARESVSAQVTEAAGKSHERNYHKLHVYRDGTVLWSEFVNRTDDLIDRQAENFAAVPSVVTVGTGSVACNCDQCSEVYSAADEKRALEDGRPYDRSAKWDAREEAIAAAVSDEDTMDREQAMLEAFDAIPAGYFDDETE